MLFCILVGRFCPLLQGGNERFLFTVHVGMELEFSHLPDDLSHDIHSLYNASLNSV
jgi:hypothetical protein